ncbi:MAG: hypothetical protein ABJQ71_15155 [Roseibium sp.]
MDQDWVLQIKETRRTFSNATWVPLRASKRNENGDAQEIGYTNEFFGCGSVAFPPEGKQVADQLGWTDIGISCNVQPYAYEDGRYSPVEQYEYFEEETGGVHLVFEHPQPVVGGRLWVLNPDLVIALRLIKEGDKWVRPEENFVVVARELFDEKGDQSQIEIKREFLLDYLAARNLSLRLSYYRQRVENVGSLEGSEYADLVNKKEQRDGGRFDLHIRALNDVFGGSWAQIRAWRTDVDEDEDAPVMGPENDSNTDFEKSEGHKSGYEGTRVEGEFWRDEWVEHQSRSVRVRGDADNTLPQFIVGTDGTRMASTELKNEDIGRWLWFRPSVISQLLGLRGFSLEWYTAETGGIHSTSGCGTHFGVNPSDFITVYAFDIARLDAWEQHIWAAQNVVPDGKVCRELLASQVKTQPASTRAVEDLLFQTMEMLERSFDQKYNSSLYTHKLDGAEAMPHISRFESRDQSSLLRLAKELVRVFSDRLDVRALRNVSTHADKEKLGSNKLLQDILSQIVGKDDARFIFGPIVGAYDMRIGDAHPTSSKIADALKLAGIDESKSALRQGEQLIANFGKAIGLIGKSISEHSKETAE